MHRSRHRKARVKRRTLHVPDLMQMRKIYWFRSFALDSAHVKFDVWNGPKSIQQSLSYDRVLESPKAGAPA